MYLFQRFFYCSKHLWKSVFDLDRSCCVIFCFMISTSSNLLPYRLSFVLGNTEESHTVQGGENIKFAALVGFCVWLRSVAQAETFVLWWICQFPDDHIFGSLRCTASCRCCRIVYTRVVLKVMSNFFLQANWEQQMKESTVVDGTSCCVILEFL